MVTNAEETKVTDERVEVAEKAVRVAVGGHPQASVRRIILWVLLFLFLVLGYAPLAVCVGALLALTDDLL
jgi:hypothetical protein